MRTNEFLLFTLLMTTHIITASKFGTTPQELKSLPVQPNEGSNSITLHLGEGGGVVVEVGTKCN